MMLAEVPTIGTFVDHNKFQFYLHSFYNVAKYMLIQVDSFSHNEGDGDSTLVLIWSLVLTGCRYPDIFCVCLVAV